MKRKRSSGILLILLSLIMVISMMPEMTFASVESEAAESDTTAVEADEQAQSAADSSVDPEIQPAEEVKNETAEEHVTAADQETHGKEEPAADQEIHGEEEPASDAEDVIDEIAAEGLEPDLEAEESTKEAEMVRAAAAAVPAAMWLEPSETNGIPSRIDLFKSGTAYQLYLPGNVDAANCYFSWEGDITATANSRTYASGECPIPTPGSTAITYSFSNGSQTASFTVTSYQGSSGVTPVFIEIDESGDHPTIAEMDADNDHNVECSGQIYIDGTQYVLTKMKGRGNATWEFAQDKKPYNITLGSKINFPGVNSEKTKKWSFLAEVTDHSLLSNRSGYYLAEKLGIGQATTSADVWMNGEYQGCYTVTPKTDSYVTKNGFMIEQDNYLEPAVSAGGDPQFKLTGLNESSGWSSAYNRITVKKMGDNLLKNDAGEVDETPANLENVANNTLKPWLQDAWDAIRSDTGRNSKDKYYTDYIDIESFAKMYLMHEYVKSYDVCAGSILFHRDGMTDADKLIAGPAWDYDNAMGSTCQNSSLGNADNRRSGDRRSGEGKFIDNVTEYKTSIFKTISKHSDFMDEVNKQYNKYRDAFDSLPNDVDGLISEISDSAKMNHTKVIDIKTNQYANTHKYSSPATLGSGQYLQSYLATTNSKTDWLNYATNLRTYVATRSQWFHDTYYDPNYCNHTYEPVVTPPTCTAVGYTTYVCSKCGDSYVGDEKIPVIAHDYQDGVCSVCGEALLTATISCSDGVSVTVYETQDLSGQSHENAVSANPRDSSTGRIDCGGDGQINFVVNLADGYVLENVTAEPATSYKNLKLPSDLGTDNYYRLTKVKGDLTITVTARCTHNFGELVEKKDPTCTETGMEAHYQCSICNKYFDSDKNETTAADLTIAALGHDPEHHAAIAATCEKDGNIEYWTCKRDGCGKYFSDEGCTEEITAADTVIGKTGHTWNDGEITTQPTCTEKGEKTFTCTVCEATRTEEVAALGHDPEHHAAVAATCEKDGNIEYWTCKRDGCGKYFSDEDCTEEITAADTVIGKTGHTWNDGEITTEPTCTEKGVKTFTCTVCGKTRTEEVAALGHDPEHHAAVAATCEKDGNVEYWTCKRDGCGKYFSDEDCTEEITAADTVIGKTGHTWNDGEITTQPTCTEKGVKTFTCTVCEATRTEEVAALGHDPEHHEAVAATCEKDGNIEYWTCKRDGCGKYFSDEDCTEEIAAADTVIGKTGHTWNDGEITTEPTCTEKGVKTFTCTVCEATRTEEVAALGHDPEHHAAVAATCEKDGNVEYWTCKRDGCGKYFSDEECTEEITAADTVIGKTGHTWNDGEITTQPTCTEKGVKTFTCTVCGKTRTEEVAALGHDLVHHEAVAATCEKDGNIEYWTCKRDGCGKYFSDEDCTEEITAADTVIRKTGHTWNAGEITTQPTCTEKGEKTFTCTVCEATRTEEVAALGHDPEHHAAVAATCEKDGNTEYWTCKRDSCGKYFSDEDCTEEITAADTVIGKTGHTWNDGEITTQPSCTEKGVKTFTCTVCEATRTEEVAALGHDPEHHAAVAATCEKDGNTEYWTCKRDGCGKYFSDEDCTEEITAADTVIGKTGHTWNDGEITTQPTCTEKGVKTFTCTVFGKTRTEEVAALGHDLVHHEAKAPTCTEKGWKEYEACSRCDFTTYEEIPAAGHKPVTDAAVDPTCTETGLTEGSHCSVCGEILEAQESVDALGHDLVHHEAKAATCTEKGWKEYEACSRCDYTTYEEIPAAGHKPVTDAAVDPTCTETGLTEGSHCSVCGEILEAQETVDALGHDPEHHAAIAATCEEDGNIEYWTCKRDGCGKYFSDEGCTEEITAADTVIGKTGHTWNDGEITTQPSCTEKGEKTFTCTVCGKTRTEEVAALGHDPEHHAAVAATCEKDGNTEYWTCKRDGCGKYFSDEDCTEEITAADTVIGKTGHTWNDGEITTEPTCTEKGEKTFTCTVCGKTRTEEVAALGHDPEHHAAVAATCEKDGNTEYWTCKRDGCGKYFSDEDCTEEITAADTVIGKTGHTWNDGEITTQPTCTEKGVKTFTCTVCEATRTEEVAALGHDPEHHAAVAATCEKDGNIEYWTCKRDGCGKYFSDEGCTEEITAADTVIGKTGHTWNDGEITTEPTCTEKGVKTFTCTVCGKTRTEEVAALGHDPEHHAAVAATCEKDGNTEYWTCKRDGCGKYFSDEGCTEEITAADTVIGKTGHTWNDGEITTEPTCTEKGEKTFTCTVCEATRTEEVAALGHDWGDWTVKTAATCTAAGEEQRVCKHDASHVETRATAELGHDYGTPVYTWNDDLTECTAMVVCQRNIQHSIVKTGTVTETITQEPTQSEKGSKTVTATFADEHFQTQTKVVEIPVLHTHISGEPVHESIVKATTAAAGGYDEVVYCSECGEEISREHKTIDKVVAPATTIIRNTVANSAKKTNDAIWDKVAGATNYELRWRTRGGSWKSTTVGNTVRGVTTGLTIGGLYEIQVRPIKAATATTEKAYGSWSKSVYRYFYTTQKIRLASKSKGTFTMSWAKDSKATGYQVLYTTNANGAGAAQNKVDVKASATSVTVSKFLDGKGKFKSGQTIYVQVRELRKVGSITYIGNISCPVAVKIR